MASFVKFAKGAGADSDSDGEEAPIATQMEAVFCKYFLFFLAISSKTEKLLELL